MKEVHLEQDYWNNISETAALNFQNNHSNQDDTKWKTISLNITPIICDIILKFLTHRQFQVFNLYWLEHNLTQTQIAKLLGISQPTVNQHLKGKIRNGKRIGGATHRIRKKLKAYLKNENETVENVKYFEFLEMLLREDSHRCNK